MVPTSSSVPRPRASVPWPRASVPLALAALLASAGAAAGPAPAAAAPAGAEAPSSPIPAPAAPAGPAMHEEAVLEAPASTVAAGSELRLSGREFAAGEEHRLRLAGTLDTHEIGEVTPDSAGTFERSIRVPDAARPGRYRLEAVAPDGDVAARLSLTVVAAAAGTGAADADEGGASGGDAVGNGTGTADRAAGGAAEREATAEEMAIDHARSGPEWAVIVLLLGASGGLGLGLLRRGA